MTVARVDGSLPEFPRGTSLKARLSTRYFEGPRERRQRSLVHRFAALANNLVTDSVGATPGEWGVFSAVPPDPGVVDDDGFELVDQWDGSSLEMTLEQLVGQHGAWPEAHALLARLPALRVSAALEGPAATRTVEDAVLRLMGAVAPDPNRQLLEHLPLRCRPTVHTHEDLDRCNSLVALRLTSSTERWQNDFTAHPTIKLHDVVVNRHVRGQGLGTVVLDELCRFADETRQDIIAMLEPGPTAPASAVLPLARWYAHHGFSVGDRSDPERWARRSHMTRPPATRE